MRNTAFAVHVVNGHFADRCAMPRCQGGNEAVQFAVERHLLEDVAAISLKSSAEVVDVDAADLGHHPVGDARWDAGHPEIIDTQFATYGDYVVARDHLF